MCPMSTKTQKEATKIVMVSKISIDRDQGKVMNIDNFNKVKIVFLCIFFKRKKLRYNCENKS